MPEPELTFGENRHCVDVKTGLGVFGSHWRMNATQRPRVRVGIIGTECEIGKTLELLEEISQPVEQDSRIDCVLHPSFPGLNAGPPFEVDLLSGPQWRRIVDPSELREARACDSPAAGLELLHTCFSREVHALSSLESRPDVVICAMSDPAESIPSRESVDGSLADRLRGFESGLKAQCIGTLPTLVLWNRGGSHENGVFDRATRAWNLSATLLHKAGCVPWLPPVARDECFVGISDYGAPDSRTIFAQIVTYRGDRFILDTGVQSGRHEREIDGSAHLTEVQAANLATQILSVYAKALGAAPRKIAIHKTTPYAVAERTGFEHALAKIEKFALVTITRRGILFVRPGSRSIPRGTAIQFGEKLGIVHTAGYAPYLRSYVGPANPQPLEVIENWGSMHFQQVAGDLLRLTKMDFDTPEFCANDPVTLHRTKRIGEILSRANRKSPVSDARFYS